jgi:16S rRNA (cytosine1407-C5)-methyltransferase
VTNVIVTKKVGQWFAKHMTERFDRVLCDAPCTAQGTVRKDSDALRYCSIESVEKMSRLQYQLLESAIHSTKVGGRIIYSTCTLTPEENEGVIFGMLERFPDQLEVVDPRTLHIAPDGYWDKAIEDSIMIQKTLNPESPPQPLLRLWPQTYDTEGFFSAVLRKTAPTKNVEPMDRMKFQELELPRSRKNEINNILKEQYGADFLSEEDRIFERGEMLLLSNQDVAHFNMPLENYALGIPFGKRLKDGRIILDHETATLRGHLATKNVLIVNDADMDKLFGAQGIECPVDLSGHVLIFHKGRCVGMGLAKEGKLKNNLPRWMVRF